jgi:hypothetical protein
MSHFRVCSLNKEKGRGTCDECNGTGKCPTCKGTGRHPKFDLLECPTCKGSGICPFYVPEKKVSKKKAIA